jgi:hypothetical protein
VSFLSTSLETGLPLAGRRHFESENNLTQQFQAKRGIELAAAQNVICITVPYFDSSIRYRGIVYKLRCLRRVAGWL